MFIDEIYMSVQPITCIGVWMCELISLVIKEKWMQQIFKTCLICVLHASGNSMIQEKNALPRGQHFPNTRSAAGFRDLNNKVWSMAMYWNMMTSLNANIFRVTGPLCGNSRVTGEFPSDAELWYFLCSAPEQRVKQTIETPVIWDAIVFIMTSP